MLRLAEYYDRTKLNIIMFRYTYRDVHPVFVVALNTISAPRVARQAGTARRQHLSNNETQKKRIVMALLMSRMFFIIHSIWFEISELNLP